jgi:hypothetical protein
MATNARTETELEGITLPAGEYFMSDPCYVLGSNDKKADPSNPLYDPKWWAVLDAIENEDDGSYNGAYTKDGLTAVIFSTDHGDGVYYDNYRRRYGVDAGMIGIIPVAMATRTDYLGQVGDMFQRAKFAQPFTCSSNDGVLRFGTIRIDTGWTR